MPINTSVVEHHNAVFRKIKQMNLIFLKVADWRNPRIVLVRIELLAGAAQRRTSRLNLELQTLNNKKPMTESTCEDRAKFMRCDRQLSFLIYRKL
jgi:hypothetical protein